MAKRPPINNEQRVCVARVGAPHGIRGDVKLWSFTADPLAVADYGALASKDGSRTLEIETLRPAKDFLVARFKGIADRDAAERLRNLDLYVPRDRLPPIEEDDEFYFADLVGLVAHDPAGTRIGQIAAVHNFGAGDLLELKLDDARDTVFVPFTDATVPHIDIAGGKVTIDRPQEIGTQEDER
jgi:16S rRNA processing protein RimM